MEKSWCQKEKKMEGKREEKEEEKRREEKRREKRKIEQKKMKRANDGYIQPLYQRIALWKGSQMQPESWRT